MRAKIIGVFTIVVVLVGVLSFTLMRWMLGDLSNREEAPRAVTAAVAELQVEGLRIERWLAHQAAQKKLREPFDAGTPAARATAATTMADAVNEAAKQASELDGVKPALVMLVNPDGVVLGRNGSTLMRGHRLGDRYPAMPRTIKAGQTGSDVWVDKAHHEQMLVSYAPIRNGSDEIVGGIAVGTQLNDERMQSTSEATSGRALVTAVPVGEGMEIVAKSAGVEQAVLDALRSPTAVNDLREALDASGPVGVAGLPKDVLGSVRKLAGYGNDKRAVIMAVTPARLVGSWASVFTPMLLAIAIGVVLTVLVAFLLDAYISRPISDLEDGLLAIINGQTDIRFELEHAVLGGLVFRINSLLNELLGVEEDDTDEQGRASIAPSPRQFRDAINVDERMASPSASDVRAAAELRDEPEDAYYQRVFGEYVAAKRSLGDPVDHLKLKDFTDRLKQAEAEMSTKHGKPFRHRIEVQGREVVLTAVPLA